MDIIWDDVRLLLAISESGSLSAAARRLAVGQPTVSRRLAELENALGYALFRRTAGGVALTSDGERLLAPARRMAEWAGEFERVAQKSDAAPRGVVRITAPPGVAFDFVAPFAGWLRRQLPAVSLEVLSTTQYLDLSRREADLAIRTRAPTQADLVCVEKLEAENGAFAARDYMRTLPKKYTMADIDWVGWAPPLDRMTPNVELEQIIPNFRPSFASDDYIVQQRAAEAGAGATFLPRIRHRFSRKTSLEELELDLGPHARGAMHLVSTKSALDIPRVRTVAELIAAEFRAAVPLPRRK
ncbi:MAG TPA: LysR family transcriptional regulator, partial [Polyangiaceae bacterium]|nr:LysR family transcriptional regulator [Polyangiaceae bacterium]